MFMMGINDNTSDSAELLCYVCYLSSIPAFIIARRRPGVGAIWLLTVGIICGLWMEAQLRLPPVQHFYIRMLLTPIFWAADLPILGGCLFLLIGWRYGFRWNKGLAGAGLRGGIKTTTEILDSVQNDDRGGIGSPEH